MKRTYTHYDKGDMDLYEIVKLIAIPRPCHSKTLEEVIGIIKDLLGSRGIPFTTQEVTLMLYKQGKP